MTSSWSFILQLFVIVDSLAHKEVWMIHAGQRYQLALKFACSFVVLLVCVLPRFVTNT